MGYSGSMSTGSKGGTNPVAAALGALAAKHMLNGKTHEPSMADKDLYAARRHEEAVHMAEVGNKHHLMQENQAHKQRMKEVDHTANALVGMNPEAHVTGANLSSKSVQFSDKPKRKSEAPPAKTAARKGKVVTPSSVFGRKLLSTKTGDSTFNPEITGPKDKPVVKPEKAKKPPAAKKTTSKSAKPPVAKKAPAAKKTTKPPAAKKPAAKKTTKPTVAKKTPAKKAKKVVEAPPTRMAQRPKRPPKK